MTEYAKQKLRDLVTGMEDEEREFILEVIKEMQNEHRELLVQEQVH